jgi:hypothetical protein
MTSATDGPDDQGRPTAVETIRRLLADPRPDLAWHHALGRQMAGALDGNGGEPTSGRGLARLLGLSLASVQQHLRFAEAFAPEEIGDLPLPWTSVVSLLTVRDPGLRAELFREAIANDWSSPKVRREVRLAQPPVGRPIRHRRVAGDISELFRLLHIASDWLARYEEWGRVLPERERVEQFWAFARGLREARPEIPNRRDHLRTMARTFERLARGAETLARDLNRAAF